MSVLSSSKFAVCRERLDVAASEAGTLLNETRDREFDASRLHWLYRQNPDGETILWSIREVATGEMVGFTVALPRRMAIDGELRTCWNCADFSIRKKYRTLGLAQKLRRAAKDAVDAGQVDLLYAHPNARMAVVHCRVGHRPVGRMQRYARLLRAGRYLRAKRGAAPAAALAGTVIDASMRLAYGEARRKPACRLHVVEHVEFDERFDRLFAEHAGGRRIVGVRDATYLNWRYRDNPDYASHAVLAVEGGALCGYLLFAVEGGAGHIKDVFPPDGLIAGDLVAAVLNEGRRRGLTSMSMVLLDGHPLISALARFGFRRRKESYEMFAYTSPGGPWHDFLFQPESWLITVGDRDV